MISRFPLRALREIVEPGLSWTPTKNSNERIRYIDVSSVCRDDLQILGTAEHTALTAPSRARKIVRANDTLFATVRPGLRRIAQVPEPLDGAVASTAFCVLRPRPDKVDPNFLFFATCSESFVAEVAELQTGASYPAVRDADVLSREIPLPALDEQRQISVVLQVLRDSLSCEAEVVNGVSVFKQVAMRELFTRGLRGEPQKDTEIGLVPSTWTVVNLGSLGRIGNGSTPKKGNQAYWDGGTFPWLTSAKVYDREISSAEQFVTLTALKECHLPRIKAGSVLVAITGQGKTLGHCAVLRMESTINQHLAYLETNTSLANPSFVRGYLETQYEHLRQIASGGGSTKGALTCAFLRDLKLPLPPLHEQDDIVAVLDAIDQKIAIHKKKRAVLEDLFTALLHKLMTGEIRVSDLDLSALERGNAIEVLA